MWGIRNLVNPLSEFRDSCWKKNQIQDPGQTSRVRNTATNISVDLEPLHRFVACCYLQLFLLFQLGFIAVISGTVYVLLRGEDTFIGKPGCDLLEDQAPASLIRSYCYLSTRGRLS
jgi:hypothetical protein